MSSIQMFSQVDFTLFRVGEGNLAYWAIELHCE